MISYLIRCSDCSFAYTKAKFDCGEICPRCESDNLQKEASYPDYESDEEDTKEPLYFR